MFLFGTLYQESSEGTVDDSNKAGVVAETDENENANEVNSGEAVEHVAKEDSSDGSSIDGGVDVEHVAKEDSSDGASIDGVVDVEHVAKEVSSHGASIDGGGDVEHGGSAVGIVDDIVDQEEIVDFGVMPHVETDDVVGNVDETSKDHKTKTYSKKNRNVKGALKTIKNKIETIQEQNGGVPNFILILEDNFTDVTSG